MHKVGVNDGDGILLGVFTLQVPSESEDDQNEHTVTADVNGEGDEVSGSVPFEEDLGSCG
jgi:hypothetical protein